MAEQTRGTKGSPDLRLLGEAFRELDGNEMARLREVGAEGTAARKVGAASAFGETVCAQNSRLRKRRRQLAVADVARSGIPRRAQAEELALLCEPVSEHLPPEVLRFAFWKRIIELKQSLRLESEARLLRQQQAEDQVCQHMDTEGLQDLRRCGDKVAAIFQHREKEFIPLPCSQSGLRVLAWSSLDVVHRAKSALSLPWYRSQTRLLQTLLAAWKTLHRTIDHVHKPEFDNAPVATTVCFEAGMCVCSAMGRKMRRCKGRLDKCIKAVCPPKTEARAMLTDGQIVLLLVAQGMPEDKAALELGDADGLVQGAPVKGLRWLHIGRQKLSKWKSCFQELSGPELSEGATSGPASVHLEAKCAFMTDWQAVQSLDLSLRWCLCAYSLDFRCCAVARFVPGHMRAILAGADDERGSSCLCGIPGRRAAVATPRLVVVGLVCWARTTAVMGPMLQMMVVQPATRPSADQSRVLRGKTGRVMATHLPRSPSSSKWTLASQCPTTMCVCC